MIIHHITINLDDKQHNSPEFVDLSDKMIKFCEKEGLKYQWAVEDTKTNRVVVLPPIKF